MKRRTNLFYTDITETNFLTFSNYTEHLNGVFLATNFKMFPSKFICLNIPSLTKDNQTDFINQYLQAYYENKLAFMRDQMTDQNVANIDKTLNSHPDDKMNYLGYLIDVIMEFDKESKIVYISSITEQNYNGTFTDIICTIDSGDSFNKIYSLSKTTKQENPLDVENLIDMRYLYGWADSSDQTEPWRGPSYLKDVQPEFDEVTNNVGKYYFESKFDRINIIDNDDPTNKKSEIEFNVIIPLYDVTLFDVKTNQTIIREPDVELNEENLDEYLYDVDHTNNNRYIKLNDDLNAGDFKKNIPYGIWFAEEKVLLKKDTNSNYAPSWSLLIGTQFKPFPNSSFLTQDHQNVSASEALHRKAYESGFATFAQILTRQNKLYDQMQTNHIVIEDIRKTLEENVEYIRHTLDELDLPSKEEITEIKNRLTIIENSLNNGGGDISLPVNKNLHNWEYQSNKSIN